MGDAQHKPLQIERDDDGVVTLTLQRPEVANALSVGLLESMNGAFRELAEDSAARCVLVTGAGEKAFCAGADLKERVGMSEEQARRTVRLINEVMNAVEALPQPTIAALNGFAFGGGLELAMACDIRIASDTVMMGLTETSLGIIPGAGGTQRLPRLVGVGRAKELIFSARRIDADEAFAIGLVEFVVGQEELLDRARLLAKAIAKNGPLAVRQAKRAIQSGFGLPLEQGLAKEYEAYQVVLASQDRLEGLQAFREKRPPVYQGK